ncbi:MAG TPA: hypothetical protein VJ851_00685 [Jatrophihabitans sp.]|nr:hypothetical protein [Jatrophihabitans sp.]
MARRDRLLRQFLRERFVVTLKNGETFDGLLDDHDESTLEFLDVHAIAAGGRRSEVDGRLYLPRAEIAYMQRPDVL